MIPSALPNDVLLIVLANDLTSTWTPPSLQTVHRGDRNPKVATSNHGPIPSGNLAPPCMIPYFALPAHAYSGACPHSPPPFVFAGPSGARARGISNIRASPEDALTALQLAPLALPGSGPFPCSRRFTWHRRRLSVCSPRHRSPQPFPCPRRFARRRCRVGPFHRRRRSSPFPRPYLAGALRESRIAGVTTT